MELSAALSFRVRDVPEAIFSEFSPLEASAGFRLWDDAPPEVAAILVSEAARGLNDRCAMVIDL